MPLLALSALAQRGPEATALAALVRERLAAEGEVGSRELAHGLVDGLRRGLVEDPELTQALAALAQQALRPGRDPEAAALVAALRDLPRGPRAPRRAAAPPPFSFPRDDGAHKGVLSEWWYWNGHLQAGDGRRFGFQLCFFAVHVGIYFLHAGVTDEAGNHFEYSRTLHRRSRVQLRPDRLGLDYGGTTAEGDAAGVQHLDFQVGPYQLTLGARPTRDPMVYDGVGEIDMPEGGMSRYYSRTSMQAEGTMSVDGSPLAVTGMVWLDRQWGNFYSLVRPWDWFCVQLDDGTRYNIFSFRKKFLHKTRSHVNVLSPQGALYHDRSLRIRRQRWWRSPHTRNHYVTRWTLELPGRGETLEVEATQEDQEMHRVHALDIPPTYWEGSVLVTRRRADGGVDSGRGYSEHMPYRRPWAR